MTERIAATITLRQRPDRTWAGTMDCTIDGREMSIDIDGWQKAQSGVVHCMLDASFAALVERMVGRVRA